MATNLRSGTAGAGDLLEILRQDHLKVDELFGQFSNASGEAEKRRIVEQIALELLPHTQAEEEIFYPALRNALSDEANVDEAYSEQSSITSARRRRSCSRRRAMPVSISTGLAMI